MTTRTTPIHVSKVLRQPVRAPRQSTRAASLDEDRAGRTPYGLAEERHMVTPPRPYRRGGR